MASNNRSHYTPVFSTWSTKTLGPQPTEAQLAVAHVFGRPGKQALGIAMALRDSGMTGAQMCGASALFDGKPTPCRNKLIGSGGLVACGLFKREPMSGGGIKLVITPAGEAWVKKAADGDRLSPKAKATVAPATNGKGKGSKPAKARGKGKGKGKPVTVPSDTPAAIEPVTSEPVTEQAAAAS